MEEGRAVGRIPMRELSKAGEFPVAKSDAEWRAELSPEEYTMLRKEGTENPGTGEYFNFLPKDGYCTAPRRPRAARWRPSAPTSAPCASNAILRSTESAAICLACSPVPGVLPPALLRRQQVQGLRLGRVRQVLLHWRPLRGRVPVGRRRHRDQ